MFLNNSTLEEKRMKWFVIGVIVLVVASTLPVLAQGSYDPNFLMDDAFYINTDFLGVAQIQNFLVSKGSYLQNYAEGGRSASQIIWDASHGYGNASGSINGITINSTTGTVSPWTIILTLQKEWSLITNPSPNNNALTWAMGYGVPDGIPGNPRYAGFTNQIEWGAWQLRYNYERSQGHGFNDFQVGQTLVIDDAEVLLGNRATSSLYRYTPHSDYNFWHLDQVWRPEVVPEPSSLLALGSLVAPLVLLRRKKG